MFPIYLLAIQSTVLAKITHQEDYAPVQQR